LRDFQTVTLNISGSTTTATVSAVDRGIAHLDMHDPALTSKLTLPAPVEMHFVHRGHYVMLVGTLASEGDPWLTFLPDARGLMASRRAAPRLQVGLPVRVTRSSGIVVQTKTVDVSASGVLLADAKLGRPLDVVRLQITMPGDRGQLQGECRIIRVGWAETALRFGALAPEDAQMLKALVEDVRYTIAQRFSEQRAAG
jgi:hypothetical protein